MVTATTTNLTPMLTDDDRPTTEDRLEVISNPVAVDGDQASRNTSSPIFTDGGVGAMFKYEQPKSLNFRVIEGAEGHTVTSTYYTTIPPSSPSQVQRLANGKSNSKGLYVHNPGNGRSSPPHSDPGSSPRFLGGRKSPAPSSHSN
ncbi:unnamed protein product [Dimorphilus gyrociliatus]|uniref:Uncharacterized protein n=1 Tax=Dimorphilus gyrociliatus TaxID=2664684 RepID=A0A7I8VB40_9ANNE|nr:unnamed protein product [Dimorphilus gyrociliatus]